MMDEEMCKRLEQNGFDLEGARKRFLNNDALYLKCLKKFLEDSSYDELQEAYEIGNCDAAFRAAHAMKGSVGNLGINSLYYKLVPMVEQLRVHDMNIGWQLKELEDIYYNVYRIIEELAAVQV